MTSSLIRVRPRRATARICAWVARAVLGAVIGAGWLLSAAGPAGARDPVPVASAASVSEQGGGSTADLVLPLVAGVAALVLAGYGYLRRTRRARTRTTPGTVSVAPPTPTAADFERQARSALVLADDCVRTSREELSFVQERFTDTETKTETEPLVHALRAAETELAAAFAIWRRYEEGLPEDPDARRQTLVGVVGRCAEAGRRLDAEAPALDRLRDLAGEGLRPALETAETRFRDLTARTVAAQDTLEALHERYARSAAEPVTGWLEQAKDRLVFATVRLNEARQAADAEQTGGTDETGAGGSGASAGETEKAGEAGDAGKTARAAGLLRAGETAVAQATALVGAVERLAAELREAADLVPAALTGAEAKLAEARQGRTRAHLTTGDLHARLAHANGVLAAVREELTSGPYDPLDALRRITRAVERLDVGHSGVLDSAARLAARSSVAGTEDFVTVHRAAVGPEARSQLAAAERALGTGDSTRADAESRAARDTAERDVRAHGNASADTDPDTSPSYGGPQTRTRLAT
ncbi:hypothetical protein [Streptomyces alanosinicus]|uniref:TPM domain-containing protein n=1 Tax=Streptomyces alanosinicus TaxID=68171 RepID=A0A918YII0_9ACTN|nr:hypothetical protein [Streptomyces alanosinicus]GHE04444.1 hypothetical protein GCM10010339_36010 [Streptomyces alanosinicus]